MYWRRSALHEGKTNYTTTRRTFHKISMDPTVLYQYRPRQTTYTRPLHSIRKKRILVHILPHISTEGGVGLGTGHTGREELDGPTVWVPETAEHEPSILLPPNHHVALLTHRAGSHHLTHNELLFIGRRNKSKSCSLQLQMRQRLTLVRSSFESSNLESNWSIYYEP